jgi:arachidonate 15-lipoxygenase
MTPCLPQDDVEPMERKSQLSRARAEYRYDHRRLPPVGMAATVPAGEAPSLGWKLAVAEAIVKLTVNGALITGARNDAPDHPENQAAKKRLHDRGIDAAHHALDAVKGLAILSGASGRASGIHDFKVLFRDIDLPTFARVFEKVWTEETTQPELRDHFARMRLEGPNPLQLRRAAEFGDRLPVTPAMYEQALRCQNGGGEIDAGDSLAAATDEGRIYLADYQALDGLPCGVSHAGQKYLTAPLALFAVPRGAGRRRGGVSLRPIAIQLGQRPGPDNPIFLPSDGWGWKIAKSFVTTADGNIHQAVHHLAHTHLALEPFALSTRRQLAGSHPLSVLLLPHLEGTLAINDAAVHNLLADGGGVDVVMSGRIDAVREVAAQAASAWNFDEAMFPAALARRGVDDEQRLPFYPYRHQGRLVWGAIHDWVEGYLHLYYPSSAEVQADTELQAWAAELVSPDGGRIKGFGQRGRILTLEYLVEAVTSIIFTASAQHAAVNFPQYGLMSFAPGFPLAAYGPPPTSKEGLTERSLLDILPPLDLAHYQLALGYMLGSVRHTRLGHYARDTLGHLLEEAIFRRHRDNYFDDPRVEEPLLAFQRRLDEIENESMSPDSISFDYQFLRPSRIPQSINI